VGNKWVKEQKLEVKGRRSKLLEDVGTGDLISSLNKILGK
jgi:hypothetical protein